MALKPCKECGTEYSTKAKTCPKCGIPTPKKTSIFTWLVAAIIVPAVLYSIFMAATTSPPPKTPEQLHREKVEQGFSAWDGSHIQLENYIKSNLKDPASYEHVKTVYNDKGDHIVVQTQYRARNSFGGMVAGSTTAKAKYDGTLIEIVVTD